MKQERFYFGAMAAANGTPMQRVAFSNGADWARAWVLAFVAMGEWAERHGTLIVERSYWTSEISGERLYDCLCPICGCGLKGLQAGVHEGSDSEYCGACRSSW